MEIIFILLPLALGIAFFFLGAYVWAVKSGQFDDTTTPAYRILIEDSSPEEGFISGAPSPQPSSRPI